MKIGFIFHTANSFISGVEYYSLGLLQALLDIDSKNQYVVFTNKREMLQSYTGNRDNLLLKDCRFIKSRLLRIISQQLLLPLIAEKEKLDLIHFPHYICPALKSKTPYIITIHDTIAIDHPNWCKITNAAYYNIFMKSAANSARKIITVSISSKKRISHNFSTATSKVNLIYPGIEKNFNPYQDIKKQKEIVAKYDLPEKYILYVGNIEPKKNILNLLRAFKILKRNGLSHKLVLVGKRNWKSKNIFKYISSQFNNGDIQQLGYADRDDLAFIYKSADCFVWPSLCEGFGFPPLEAFACGLPIAATQTGILKEINKQAYSAIDPENPEQIAESVTRLITDNKLREQQIKTALVEIRKYSWPDCAHKTLKLYKELVKSNT